MWVPRRSRRADPFEALEVQMTLARLEGEIDVLLHGQDRRFARAHHLRAATDAYEDALREGCRLASVEDLPPRRTTRGRLIAEAELRSRGWSW
jgi:hypothetical protein